VTQSLASTLLLRKGGQLIVMLVEKKKGRKFVLLMNCFLKFIYAADEVDPVAFQLSI